MSELRLGPKERPAVYEHDRPVGHLQEREHLAQLIHEYELTPPAERDIGMTERCTRAMERLSYINTGACDMEVM